MHTQPYRLFVFTLLIAVALVGCDSTEPEDGIGEEELIDRVVLRVTNSAATSLVQEIVVADSDGLNGLPNLDVPTLRLRPGVTYTGSIQLFSMGEEITDEIREEAAEHQFFYAPQGDLDDVMTVTITDRESDYLEEIESTDLPVGLTFEITSSVEASEGGSLRVLLGHYDEEVKRGSNLSAETDLDFLVPVEFTGEGGGGEEI